MKKITMKACVKNRLLGKIQPLLEPYGIKKEAIATAIEKSLTEIKRDGSDFQMWLLSLIFGKIFRNDCFLWINQKTPSGNAVSLDVIATAHSIWGRAQKVAVRHGLDEIDASQAMNRIVGIVADRLRQGAGASVLNIRKYLFRGYVNELKRIAKRVGIVRNNECNPLTESESDNGDFVLAMESAILCDEMVSVMPPKGQCATVYRYVAGCSCQETAEAMGGSSGAVRKALCVARRRALDLCKNDVRASGSKIAKSRKKQS